MGLQNELCVNFQRIREIETDKLVYVHTYNIPPSPGSPSIGLRLTDHSREYWAALPQYLGPRVLGNVH